MFPGLVLPSSFLHPLKEWIPLVHSKCPYSVWFCSWPGRPCAQAVCWSRPPLRAAGSAVRPCPGPPCPPSTAGSPLLREHRPCRSSPASLLPHLPSASAMMWTICIQAIKPQTLSLHITHSCYITSGSSLIIMNKVESGSGSGNAD